MLTYISTEQKYEILQMLEVNSQEDIVSAFVNYFGYQLIDAGFYNNLVNEGLIEPLECDLQNIEECNNE